MSQSFVDRILLGQSLTGSGPITQAHDEAHASGFIGPDPAHWSIERFIPLEPQTLIDYLVGREELRPEQATSFRNTCDQVGSILQSQLCSYRSQFAAAYAPVDPDNDLRLPDANPTDTHTIGSPADDSEIQPDESAEANQQNQIAQQQKQRVTRVLTLCDQIFQQAGFRPLEREEISRCIGVVSQFGVPLHVDLEIFRNLVVYARGDIIGSRIRRRLRRLYRREQVEVQLYQRMIVVFQLRDDDQTGEQLLASTVHLRMFKNIPKQDVETLLPGTKVRISGMDHVKIIVPSLGGFLMSLRRIAQTALLFAVITLHWSTILVALLAGYLVKSVFSYFQTKNRHQLNLTRNLYFQKIDANAGVAHHAIQLAHQQHWLETILAIYAIATDDEPMSSRRLRRKCERLIREAIRVEVDFDVEATLDRLQEANVLQSNGDIWMAVSSPDNSPDGSSQAAAS